MAQDIQNCMEKLKSLRIEYEREIKEKRRQFLIKLYSLVRDWQDQLPNLRDILYPEEIEVFLKLSVKYEKINAQSTSFIDFVIRAGYKDEPEVNLNGKPSSRRTTPVHSVTESRSEIASNLFKIYDRFDVNYTDENGLTHFHVACMAGCYEVVKKFLELGKVDPNLLVPETGDSSLHFALHKRNNKVVELLLRASADPNLTNKKGSTALHIACNSGDEDSAKMIFELSDEKYRPVQVNAQDNEGNAPLHYAMEGHDDLFEFLLRNGANPNIANKEGATPLHFIVCNFADIPDFLELFVKISREVNQLVQIDARDNLGRTPLQLAVANLRSYNVKELLSSGANPSNFVFPDGSYFGDNLKFDEDSFQNNLIEFKYISVLDALIIVESLEEWGYELKKGDALTIMKCFAKYEIIKKSPLVEERWYEANWFAEKAKKDMIDDDLSFYDLMRLQPDAAAKLLIDYFYLFSTVNYKFISLFHEKACGAHLCEIASRQFYRRWALPSFKELTRRYNLSNVCCDMIIGHLTNDDLFNICLAAEGQS